METRNSFTLLKQAFGVLKTGVFLFGMILVSTGNAAAQTVREIRIKVNEVNVFRAEGEVNSSEVKIEVGNPSIARARYDSAKKEFRTQGLAKGNTTVTFIGAYQGNRSGGTGGILGGIQQNNVRFRYVLNITVVDTDENPGTDRPGIPSERGKNVRIFYTNLRQYDAQKADVILRQRGYVAEKRLIDDGPSTQSQQKALYCLVNSGGTEEGVRFIAELVRNLENVRTECVVDRPHTEPEYVLWIVSEQPLIAEFEDYKRELEEAKELFIARFGAPSGKNNIRTTYLTEFEKEGTGDWNRYSGSWSDAFWLKYVQPNSRTVAAAIFERPLAILQTSVNNVKSKGYAPTPAEIDHFRNQMNDWRTRKDELTPLLNEVIRLDAQHNSDIYANSRLKTLSAESQRLRAGERRQRLARIDAQINQIKERPVFAFTLGGAKDR